jgi:hypothetical protein
MSDFDPTRTLQWNAQRRARPPEEPAWKLSNHQFFWNQRLLKPIMDAELHKFITPVANMVIHSTVLPLAGKKEYKRGKAHDAQLVLVSRRSCNNQGQRYIKRGIDPEGNVANFVETEQIFRYDNNTFSFTQVPFRSLCIFFFFPPSIPSVTAHSSPFLHIFVVGQIRGSIPLFWQQLDKYKLRPKIRVESDPDEHLPALHKHIQQLQQVYFDASNSDDARITIVNLIDKAGDQGRLGTEFRKALAALRGHGGADDLTVQEAPTEKGVEFKSRSSWREALTRDDLPEQRLTHLWFDFHHNCKGRHLRSLRRLYPAIFANRTVGYFGPVEGPQAGRALKHEQADVVRTNCIDCLDRTNVMQVRSSCLSTREHADAPHSFLRACVRACCCTVCHRPLGVAKPNARPRTAARGQTQQRQSRSAEQGRRTSVSHALGQERRLSELAVRGVAGTEAGHHDLGTAHQEGHA